MPSTGTLSTVDKTVEIIYALRELDGARVSELADHLGIATSTVHAHLATLKANEFVVTEGDVYHLGMRFLQLGKYAQRRREGYVLADEYTKKLVEETGYRAIFLVEEHGQGVFIHMYSGEHPPWMHTDAGQRAPLHPLAAGKAILAFYPESRVFEILREQGMSRQTRNTITTPDAFLDELAEVRQTGVAFNDCENVEGIRAIGVPARAPSGEVIGSFSISGPKDTMPDDEFRNELPNILKGVVNEYELELTL